MIVFLLLSLEERDCVDRSSWTSHMGRNRNWVRLFLTAPEVYRDTKTQYKWSREQGGKKAVLGSSPWRRRR